MAIIYSLPQLKKALLNGTNMAKYTPTFVILSQDEADLAMSHSILTH